MKKSLRLIATLALLASFSPGTAAADEKHPGKHHATAPMARVIAAKSGTDFEAAFLGLMTLHHEDGVKMAKMALEKAQSDELKAMMQKSMAQQQEEIAQMTKWLQQWHKKSPSDFEMPAEAKQMMQKHMQETQVASGKEFDQTFAAKMAEHHKEAIEMGRLAETSAQHDEAKQLGKKIADSQEKEREKLMAMAK